MAAEDRLHWDQRYRDKLFDVYPPPDALLVAYAPSSDEFAPLAALDLAAGLCQNALWLAEHGYQVDAMDISRVGLERGRAEMAMRNLRTVNFIPTDLDEVRLPEETYDLVCVFRYLNRQLFPPIRWAVKPGGMVIYQTFNMRRMHTRPMISTEYLLALGELPRFFPDWKLLHDEDRGELSRLVARKPAAGGA